MGKHLGSHVIVKPKRLEKGLGVAGNAPNRIEVMLFHAEDIAGARLCASRQIYRFPGQPARLLPLVFSEIPTAFVMDPEGKPVR